MADVPTRFVQGRVLYYGGTTAPFGDFEEFLHLIRVSKDRPPPIYQVELTGQDSAGSFFLAVLDFNNASFDFAQRKAGSAKPPAGGRDRLLGQILVDAGVVTTEQLTQAMQEQAGAPGTKIGAILVRLGMVTPKQILDALCDQVGLPKR